VTVVVNGGTAGVHANEGIFERPEFLDLVSERIEETKGHDGKRSLILGAGAKGGQ